MDAAATIRTPLAQLARAAMLTAIAGYLALALSLVARRIAGGLQPLDAPLLSALAVSVLAAVLLVRMLWPTSRERRAVDWFVRIAPSASALLLAAAVSLRGSSPPALAALWLAIVAVEAATISRDLRRRPRLAAPTRSVAPSPLAPHSSPLSPQATQSLVREIDDAGVETVSGQLRAVLRAGERTTFLHIAFCPPLPSMPHIECRQIAGPEAEIKVAQSQTYGARFDVRLNRESADAVQVQLQFSARSVPTL